MSWHIDLNGTDEYLQTASVPVLGDSFEFVVTIPRLDSVTGQRWIVGFWRDLTANDRAFVFRINNGSLEVFFSSDGTATTAGATTAISTGNNIVVRGGKNGATSFVEADNNGESTAAVFSGDVFTPVLNPVFGCKNNPTPEFFFDGNISQIDLLINGDLKNSWRAGPSAHDGATPVLVDVIGGNDATGINMATDGSNWGLSVDTELSGRVVEALSIRGIQIRSGTG